VSGLENPRVFKIEKKKDGETGMVHGFKLEQVKLGKDEDGDDITSCVVVPIEGTPKAEPSRKRKPPVHSDTLRALDFLKDTIADHGESLIKPGLPSLTATKIDHWRERLKQRGLYDGDNAGRQDFYRAKKRLISEKLITVDGDFVWIVPAA